MRHFFLFFWTLVLPAQPSVTLQRTEPLLGTSVSVQVVDENEEIGYIHIEEALAEMRRIDQMISPANPDSEISRINRSAGREPVRVPAELFRLLQRAVKISELTQGAFDITTAALDSIWRFDGSMSLVPGEEAVRALMPLVGYRKIVLDPDGHTVWLPGKGMRIDLGALGTGYALDRARALMRSRQVLGGMINAGGTIAVWGKKASGEHWLLGINDPNKLGQILAWIPLVESSVSLLRNDQRYVERNGIRYGEILSPYTGSPITGSRQVTVFAASTELSAALSIALCILGPEEGIPMIEVLGDTEAVLVGESGFMYWTSGLMLAPR